MSKGTLKNINSLIHRNIERKAHQFINISTEIMLVIEFLLVFQNKSKNKYSLGTCLVMSHSLEYSDT